MNGEPRLFYYEVTTKENARYYRCGEVGDVVRRLGFGAQQFTSIGKLSDGQLEVKIKADEQRIQEIRDMPELFKGTLTPEGEEVCIVSHSFITREYANIHAIKLIEEEIEYFKQKISRLQEHF